MYQKWAKKGKNPGRPASPRPAGLAPPKTQSRLLSSGNVTHSRGSKSRVGHWFKWIHRKASTSSQRTARQPKIKRTSATHFPGDCTKAVQSPGKTRGRNGPEGGRPTSPRPDGLATAAIGQTQLSTDSRERSEPLSERRRPRGGTHRLASLWEAGRSHFAASQALVSRGS